MRTEEQLKNFRRVLAGQLGPYAFFMADEDVNHIADNLQHRVDDIEHTWEVRVRFENTKIIPWSEIKKEPTAPKYSLNDMRVMCNKLLAKYSTIEAIQIALADQPDYTRTFSRQ